jgi:hypothetical protein
MDDLDVQEYERKKVTINVEIKGKVVYSGKVWWNERIASAPEIKEADQKHFISTAMEQLKIKIQTGSVEALVTYDWPEDSL